MIYSLFYKERSYLDVSTLFTLEYDFTENLGPRYTEIFKASLTGADILPI